MESENIVETLVSQHRKLQKDLGSLSEVLAQKEPNVQIIDVLLQQFSHDLMTHLHLENEVFYVDLLQKMKNKGQDTKKTELFIAEMKDIEKAIIIFLDTNNTNEKISQNIDLLRINLPSIVNTLNLRIESEESGVYSYWGLFK